MRCPSQNFLVHHVQDFGTPNYINMARTTNKTRRGKLTNAGRAAAAAAAAGVRVEKVLKKNQKDNHKQTKAKIEKINALTLDVHSEMKEKAPGAKVLDAKILREDLKKDEETSVQNKEAEKALAAQVDELTEMVL